MSISNLLQTNDFVQRNNAKALAAKWERTGLDPLDQVFFFI